MSHPLIEIYFVFSKSENATRHRYHVPRVGDEVEITYNPQPGQEYPQSGVVTKVVWEEDSVRVYVDG